MKFRTFQRLLLGLGCRQRSDNRSLVTQCPKCGAKDAFDCRGRLSEASLQCDTCNSRMEVMGWETDGHHILWFDFPPHIVKRKQARKFAQAIRLLLPASCLMHADTEEVFGCQIIRVGIESVERMLEEQAERHDCGYEPEDIERAKAKVLASRPKCPGCGRRMPHDFDPAKHLCDDCMCKEGSEPERKRRAKMLAEAVLKHKEEVEQARARVVKDAKAKMAESEGACIGCGKSVMAGFLYCGACLQHVNPSN